MTVRFVGYVSISPKTGQAGQFLAREKREERLEQIGWVPVFIPVL